MCLSDAVIQHKCFKEIDNAVLQWQHTNGRFKNEGE